MTEPTSPSNDVPSPALPPAATPATPGRVWWGLGVALALVLAGIALAATALMWQRLTNTQQELARRHQEALSKVVEARTLAEQSGNLVDAIQARLSVAEIRLSEVSLQRSQLEELMLSVSRSRDDNLVQDLESAIRLAQQQAQLTGSVQPLLSALQAADQRIARAAQPRLNPVQRAIARDIERIQGASVADLPSLLSRLDELVRQVDDWPVRNQMGPRMPDPAPVAPDPAAETADKTADKTAAPADHAVATPSETDPAAAADALASGESGWSKIVGGWQQFWQRVWTDVAREGRELVRVSRIDEPDAMLLSPDQAFLLKENIKLKLLNARLALLGRQAGALQADLKSIDVSMQRFFDDGQPAVAAAQASIRELRQQLVTLDLPRPDESLAALQVAAGGR